jgi:DNA-binding SARP family transcriptional activator
MLLTRAIELYRNPFLTTLSMKWSLERQEALKQMYAQALVSMARLSKRNGDWPAALGHFVRALKEVPQREDLHREVMNLYLQQEMYADAARQYRLLEKIVNETLQIEPDRESRELYATVQARI